MDRAAAGFKTVTASVRMVNHTAVINEDAVDIGTMYLKRVRPREIRMLVDITEPDPKTLAVSGAKAEVYYPKIKTVQEYEIGKYRGLMDQFLLLGFGSTAADLESGYGIRFLGQQSVAGQPAAQMELIPKSPKVLEHLTKVELWIGDNGYPAQQKFYMPGGDYRLVTYTGVKMNPSLPDSALKLQLPKGVKRETPLKQ
jgi:outer membrane lipoprotein-sorting protein